MLVQPSGYLNSKLTVATGTEPMSLRFTMGALGGGALGRPFDDRGNGTLATGVAPPGAVVAQPP